MLSSVVTSKEPLLNETREINKMNTRQKTDLIRVSSLAPLSIEAGSGLDIESQESRVELHYLDKLSEEEVVGLEKKYGKTALELDNLIAEYYQSFWYYRSENWIANATNIPYCALTIATSKLGIQSFAELFNPDISVPDSIGYGIGVPMSVLSTLLYLLTFSPKNEAVISTLEYIKRDPIKKRIHDAYDLLCKTPKQAMIEAVKFLRDQALLIPPNFTGAMSVIVGISGINDLSLPAKLAIAALTNYYCGIVYYGKYINPDYYANLDFWENKEKRPSLREQLRTSGSCSNKLTMLDTIYQIVLQGGSAMTLRSFPLNYYLAQSAGVTLEGIWPPAWLVAGLTFFQSGLLYEKTFNHYMVGGEKLDKAFKLKFPNDSQQQKEDFINRVVASQPYGYVFKLAPDVAIQMLFWGLVGAYFIGSRALAPLMAPALTEAGASVVSVSLGAAIWGGLLTYPAEKKRVTDHLVNEVYESEQKVNNQEPKKPASNQSIASHIVGAGLATISAASSAMSQLGMVNSLLGNSPAVMAPASIIVSGNMLNNILFNATKVTKTLSGMFSSCNKKVYVSSVTGTLFKPAPESVNEAQENSGNDKSSLCCLK